jgi:hypothetical protein
MIDPREPIYSRLKPKTKTALEAEAELDGRTLSSLVAHICDLWVARKKEK